MRSSPPTRQRTKEMPNWLTAVPSHSNYRDRSDSSARATAIGPGQPERALERLRPASLQAAWVLAAVRLQRPTDDLHIDWRSFAARGTGLLMWEAFVTAAAKGTNRVDDATIAVRG